MPACCGSCRDDLYARDEDPADFAVRARVRVKARDLVAMGFVGTACSANRRESKREHTLRLRWKILTVVPYICYLLTN